MERNCSKQEATEYLRGLKYNAELIEGIVVIWTPEPLERREKEQVRNRLRSIGYRGSWGYRCRRQEVSM